MGTGKSAVSAHLSRQFDLEKIEMDQLIEKREKKTIPQIFDRYGEQYFRERESQLLEELTQKQSVVVSCGGGVVLKEENRKRLKEIGTVVLLTASGQTIYQRIKHNSDRPLLKKRMDQTAIEKMLSERKEFYQAAADLVVATDGKSIEEIGQEIGNLLDLQ
ncbi:MAG TPA: shikimate kinase [Eubacteriaceae bacterium]|nr:shikimate kinase [Eubacteriaceae bacterium]